MWRTAGITILTIDDLTVSDLKRVEQAASALEDTAL